MENKNSASNTQIRAGIIMLLLVAFYCSDRVINHLNLRLFDWISWAVMIITGVISIAKGIQLNKK